MNILITSIFTVITFTTIVCLEVVKIILLKKPTYSDVILGFCLLLLTLILPIKDHLVYVILLCIFDTLALGISILYFIFIVRLNNIYQRKLTKNLKDSEYDFYLQVNKNNKIRDFSSSILKISGLTKKDIMHKECWNLLFNALEVTSINKMEATTTNFNTFVSEFNDASSKFKTYNFVIDIVFKDDPVTYKGIIEPLYFNNILIGRNIYLYIDRMRNIEILQHELRNAVNDIERLRNQNYAMMSLFDGTVLYFDFQTKMYVATESFCRFTNTHKREYTFTELVDLIHPDDLDTYIEQSETINSMSVTRLKFRLLINDAYYYVTEDSIYLSSDTDLISIIRVIEKGEESNVEATFSTKEAIKIIESLNCTNINLVIEKTENILNTVIGESQESISNNQVKHEEKENM